MTASRPPLYYDGLVIFLMSFGPGAAMSCYNSLMGFYEHELQSKQVTVFMRLAVFLPFPAMFVMQRLTDSTFDKEYGTKASYFARLVGSQMVLVLFMLVWMCMPSWLVLADIPIPVVVTLGIVIGSAAAPNLGSTIKVAAALEPGLLVAAQLGNTAGNAMAAIWMACLSFSPQETHARLCLVLAMPIPICVFACAYLSRVFWSGHLDEAFSRLDPREKSLALAASESDRHCLGSARDMAGTGGTSDTEKPMNLAVPTWVWAWIGVQGCGHCFDFILLTLVAYFGTELVTHELAGSVYVAQVIGRILALPWRSTTWFQQRPLHEVVVCCFFSRVLLLTLLFAHLCGALKLPSALLLIFWCFLHCVGMMHSSLSDMTTAAWVQIEYRDEVAHRTLFCMYFSIVLGMAIAYGLVAANAFPTPPS